MPKTKWITRTIVAAIVIGLSLLVSAGVWYKLDSASLKSNIKSNPVLFSYAKTIYTNWKNIRDPLREVKKRRQKEETYEVLIYVNPSKQVGKIEPFWSGIGDDLFFNHVTSSSAKIGYKYISEINKHRPIFRFWRSHNIFSDREAPWGLLSGGKVYQEDSNGNPIYNWDRLDQVFDLIVNAGLTPIVELGFMPEALTSDPDRVGDWGVANVAPPKDYVKWKELVKETVQHLLERYGDQILNWYFEVWNEPDLYYFFWIESNINQNECDIEEFNKLYDYTIQGILEVDDRLKVGGPAIAGWGNILKAFLQHVDKGINYVTGKRGSRIDFLSFHRYGLIDEHLIRGSKGLIDEALKINKKRFSKLPILIDEYGPTTESREDWKNTPYVATWIAAVVSGYYWLADNFGDVYLPTGMVFWSGIGTNYEEGRGMVGSTVRGPNNKLMFLRGPVLNVFELLSYLGSTRIEFEGREFGDSVHGFASINKDNEIAVLIYRLGSINSDNPYSIVVSLTIEPIESKNYVIRQFRIDKNHSNPYQIYRENNGIANFTSWDFENLKMANQLQENIAPQSLNLGTEYNTVIKMPVNSVHLLILSPDL